MSPWTHARSSVRFPQTYSGSVHPFLHSSPFYPAIKSCFTMRLGRRTAQSDLASELDVEFSPSVHCVALRFVRLVYAQRSSVLYQVLSNQVPVPVPVPSTSLPQSNFGKARRSRRNTHNKVHVGNNGTPQIHPQNCPSPSTITTPV